METIDKNMSYIIGLLQTDGNLYESSKTKGRISLELNIKDFDIIDKLIQYIPVNYSISKRERVTNYGQSSTISLRICDKNFREFIKKCGVPSGKKSNIIDYPKNIKYSEIDYIRGLYDGDGSLGITSNNKPFISIVTSSENLMKYITNYITKILQTPLKNINRNNRDKIYNITIMNEDAVNFTKHLYYENCLSLNRKNNKAQEIFKWKRPDNIKKRIFLVKKWTKNENEFIKTHTVRESTVKLARTKQSIKTQLWRLSDQLTSV